MYSLFFVLTLASLIALLRPVEHRHPYPGLLRACQLLKGGTIQLFTLQERMSQPVELIVVLTQHLCWLLGTSVRKTRRFLRTEVLPLSVVDNLDFSANRLTALETLLMLASQGAYQAPHFKQ